MLSPIDSMKLVARRLETVDVRYAFVGGAIVSMLVDDPRLTEIRPTKDLDMIVEVVTKSEFYALEEQLRKAGFRNHVEQGAPIVRWIVDECLVDVMPIDSSTLGMNSNWFPEALESASQRDIGSGQLVPIISPALFIATKLEAFKDRGGEDYYASHDLEDIITLVEGRERIAADVRDASEEVRAFVAREFAEMLKSQDFIEALPANLAAIARSRESIVRRRFEEIAGI